MDVVIKNDDTVFLTPNHVKIVKMYADGHRTASIAKKLKLSPRTIESHVESMKSKFKAKTQSHLVAIFFRKLSTY